MKHKKSLTLLAILFLALLVSQARAEWQIPEGYPQGYWESSSYDNLKASGDNMGQQGFFWTPAINNFSAFWVNCTIRDYSATLRPWSFSDFKSTQINMTVSSGLFGGSFQVNFKLYSAIYWFGLSREDKVYFGSNYEKSHNLNPIPYQVNLYIIKTSNSSATIKFMFLDAGVYDAETGELIPVMLEETLDLSSINPNFFDSSIVIGLGVFHEGSGHFELSVIAEDYVDEEMPEIPPNINLSEIVQETTSWITDLFNFLSGGVAFLIGGIQLVGVFMGQFIPILPFLFLFWCLDAIISSVMAGSIKPIGNFVMTIWEFALKLWDTIIHLGELIWDAITFWT